MSLYTQHAGDFIPVGGIDYVNTAPVEWERGEKGSGHWFRIKAGTRFQVSVPWWLQWLVDPHDPRFLKAALLHDEMLKRGVDRVRAAAEFNLALKADGVERAERLRMFLAVAVYKFD